MIHSITSLIGFMILIAVLVHAPTSHAGKFSNTEAFDEIQERLNTFCIGEEGFTSLFSQPAPGEPADLLAKWGSVTQNQIQEAGLTLTKACQGYKKEMNRMGEKSIRYLKQNWGGYSKPKDILVAERFLRDNRYRVWYSLDRKDCGPKSGRWKNTPATEPLAEKYEQALASIWISRRIEQHLLEHSIDPAKVETGVALRLHASLRRVGADLRGGHTLGNAVEQGSWDRLTAYCRERVDARSAVEAAANERVLDLEFQQLWKPWNKHYLVMINCTRSPQDPSKTRPGDFGYYAKACESAAEKDWHESARIALQELLEHPRTAQMRSPPTEQDLNEFIDQVPSLLAAHNAALLEAQKNEKTCETLVTHALQRAEAWHSCMKQVDYAANREGGAWSKLGRREFREVYMPQQERACGVKTGFTSRLKKAYAGCIYLSSGTSYLRDFYTGTKNLPDSEFYWYGNGLRSDLEESLDPRE